MNPVLLSLACLILGLLWSQTVGAQCMTGSCPTPARYVYRPPARWVGVQPTYQLQATTATSTAAPTHALDAVNRLRAAYGRPPLAWDATLAAYASRNNGVHAPGSNGGAGQCWAGVSDPIAAVSMWARSPAHLAIILGARQCVGVSPCPTGCTLNAR
jgi:uncharacterized protein YkwD